MLKRIILAVAACAIGVVAQLKPIHQGKPSGSVKTVDGVEIYHAYPPSNKTDLVIIIYTDIYGVQLLQNKLLADSFAKADYTVLIPDYFKGDPIPTNQTGFDREAWRKRHTQAEVSSIIETTIKYARTTLKAKKVGGAGYCFGGPYVVRSIGKGQKENYLDAGFIAHPGAITDKELIDLDAPLAIAAAETDQSLSTQRRHEIEDILMKGQLDFQTSLYSGVAHGFAVRANIRNRTQLFAKESAFMQAVLWFDDWI